MSEMSASVERVCQQCGKNLDGEPAILINGECFCFFHAKRAHPAATADLLRKEQSLNADFGEQLAEFNRNKKEHDQILKNRQDRRFHFSIDNGFSGKPKWSLYFLAVIFLWAMHPVVGLVSIFGMWLLVTSIEEQLQEKKCRLFDAHFPEPQFTQAPPEYQMLPRVTLDYHPSNNDLSQRDTGYDRRKILKRDGNRCQNCGTVFEEEKVEVHHVDPFAKGGTDCTRNLITLCLECHIEEDWFGHIHKKRGSSGVGKQKSKRRRVPRHT